MRLCAVNAGCREAGLCSVPMCVGSGNDLAVTVDFTRRSKEQGTAPWHPRHPLRGHFGVALVVAAHILAWSVVAEDKAPVIYLEKGKAASEYRNVALNPKAAATAEASSFPHATSNNETNKKEFAARCAIDGNRANKDVHGCGSWGPQKNPDIWWKLDFGRPVEIDKLTIFLRAAWGHDSYWKEGVVEFSDGSTEKLALKKVAEGQEFSIAKRTVTWLTLKDLKPDEPKWCALCEFEAWGKDAPGATK